MCALWEIFVIQNGLEFFSKAYTGISYNHAYWKSKFKSSYDSKKEISSIQRLLKYYQRFWIRIYEWTKNWCKLFKTNQSLTINIEINHVDYFQLQEHMYSTRNVNLYISILSYRACILSYRAFIQTCLPLQSPVSSQTVRYQ